MNQWSSVAPPPLDDQEEDRGGGRELAMPLQTQQIAIQTQMGGALQVRRAAMALPRNVGNVRRSIDQLAELVEAMGESDSWEYAFPVKNRRKGTTDWITGPTIKCANAIARCWGNCQVSATRVDDIGGAWVIYSTFIDYETGFEITRAFQQRKGQASVGGGDAGRSEDIAFQIGVSKSMRNIVVNALGDVVQYALHAKNQRWSRRIKNEPDSFRDRIKGRLQEIGYPLPKVEAWANGRIDKWSVETIAQIMKILTAYSEGALTDLDDVFAPSGRDIDAEAKPTSGEAANGERSATPAGPQSERKASVTAFGQNYERLGMAVNRCVKELREAPPERIEEVNREAGRVKAELDALNHPTKDILAAQMEASERLTAMGKPADGGAASESELGDPGPGGDAEPDSGGTPAEESRGEPAPWALYTPDGELFRDCQDDQFIGALNEGWQQFPSQRREFAEVNAQSVRVFADRFPDKKRYLGLSRVLELVQ